MMRICYLLSFPLPDPAVFLAPATKNIFPGDDNDGDARPPVSDEAEWKGCWKDLWKSAAGFTFKILNQWFFSQQYLY